MKIIRNIVIFIYIILGVCALSQAQANLSLSTYADARLLLVGDERGNDAGTINLLTRLNMNGKQQKYGYMVVAPEFEYVNLKGGKYIRYSANVGYNFNKLVIDSVEMGCYAGWGMTNRNNTSFHSISFSGVLNYKISNTFKITSMLQLVERKDINDWRYSGFIGIEINLKQIL